MSDVIDFKTLVEQKTLDPISEWRDKSDMSSSRHSPGHAVSKDIQG